MPIRVTWQGPGSTNHSLEIVNREIVRRLERREEVELGDAGDAQVTVRHAWPLDTNPPDAGRWVVMQPWEYGSIPRRWLDLFRLEVDEVWVYSEFNRVEYVAEGLPEEQVQVIPLGVDERFLALDPDAEPFPLQSRHGFRFLFVGATILRKGIDLLLDAYTSNFTSADDVCLVIKDFGTDSYYRNQNHAAHIRELQRDASAPAIEYISADLPVEAMHSLYRSCDCLVHPYRAEGFGLPIAEAMASGLPVIATGVGGAAGLCTPDTAMLIPARRRPVPHRMAPELVTVSPPWWMEPDVRELGRMMRSAFEGRMDLAKLAGSAQDLIADRFTWEHTAATVAGNLARLGTSAGLPARADTTRLHRLLVAEGARSWEHGNVQEALTHFSRAAEIDRTDDLLFNLAATALATGDLRSAGRLLDELEQRTGTADEGTRGLRETIAAQVANAPVTAGATPAIRWKAAVYSASGYADESRNFLLGLLATGSAPAICLEAVDAKAPARSLDPAERTILDGLGSAPRTGATIEYQHVTPDAIEHPSGGFSVLRTMFETDGLPPQWALRCNLFDEVWVPSEFNRDTFARSGVLREKIRVVPGCFDRRKFDRTNLPPVKVPGARGFRFLSVFDFSPRKGWDLLLRAYAEEFTPTDDVTLVLKVTRFMSGQRTPEHQVRDFLASEGHRHLPNLVLIDDAMPEQELLGLYAACDAFVLPSRGEGWGRPYMEAMALGLPTIGTRWSANLEFMNDSNSFLVDIDGLEPCDRRWDNPLYQGQRWAAPSIRSLREQMRTVIEDRDAARERGANAMADMAQFDRLEVGKQIARAFSTLGHPLNHEITV